MIKISIRKTLLIALLCLCAGMGLNSFFKGGYRNPAPLPTTVQPARELRQKADTIEQRHEEQISILNNRNKKLQQSLSETDVSLRQSKEKLAVAEQNIRQLLTVNTAEDSVYEPTTCDTLREYVNSYLQENNHKDSLYDAKILLLENMVSLKDSALAISTNTHRQMGKLLDQTILQHSWLERENFTMKEQMHKTKKKQKLLTIGLALISGVAAGYLVTK